MRIVVAGTGRLGAAVMESLIENGHAVIALLQNGRELTHGKRWLRSVAAPFSSPETDALALAYRNKIPTLWLSEQDESNLAPLRSLEPDLIVVAGFGLIFQRPLLDIPRIGCVNVHSSLLPKHRGPSPFAHVILSGDSETGITVHAMTEGIDDGPILFQAKCPVSSTDTSAMVYAYCCALAYAHIGEVIQHIEQVGLEGKPQSEGTYDPRMDHETAKIDWTRPAEDIETLIRAATVYFPAWFVHRGRTVRITRATYDPRKVDEAPGTVVEASPYPVVATGRGRLVIHQAYIERRWQRVWPSPWSPLEVAEVL